MGAGTSFHDDDYDKTLDLDGQGRVIERDDRRGNLRKRVYSRRGGLQVGCTFVTDQAMKKLVEIWQEGE